MMPDHCLGVVAFFPLAFTISCCDIRDVLWMVLPLESLFSGPLLFVARRDILFPFFPP